MRNCLMNLAQKSKPESSVSAMKKRLTPASPLTGLQSLAQKHLLRLPCRCPPAEVTTRCSTSTASGRVLGDQKGKSR